MRGLMFLPLLFWRTLKRLKLKSEGQKKERQKCYNNMGSSGIVMLMRAWNQCFWTKQKQCLINEGSERLIDSQRKQYCLTIFAFKSRAWAPGDSGTCQRMRVQTRRRRLRGGEEVFSISPSSNSCINLVMLFLLLKTANLATGIQRKNADEKTRRKPAKLTSSLDWLISLLYPH